MSNLRQAAEQALEALRNAEVVHMEQLNAMYALQEALAHEALDRMVAENQRLGLYDEDNLQTAIEKGTKAWADVSDATEWVEELRGNTPDCETHPDAPHGFDRNASHSEDRYVCECEGWEPPKREWVGLTDEEIHEVASKKWWDWEDAFDIEGFSRALEAKLKDKNND